MLGYYLNFVQLALQPSSTQSHTFFKVIYFPLARTRHTPFQVEPSFDVGCTVRSFLLQSSEPPYIYSSKFGCVFQLEFYNK